MSIRGSIEAGIRENKEQTRRQEGVEQGVIFDRTFTGKKRFNNELVLQSLRFPSVAKRGPGGESHLSCADASCPSDACKVPVSDPDSTECR